MDETTEVTSVARSTLGRIGIVLLNLLAPGAGLLRVERPLAAAICWLIPSLLLLLVLGVYWGMDELTFPVFALTSIGTVLGMLGAYTGAMVMTWRASRHRDRYRPLYARWYSIAVAITLSILIGVLATPDLQSYYRNYYIPAESMLPTLQLHDRVVFDMREPAQRVRRGDIIVYDNGGADFAKRLVAIAGDRVAVRNGNFILNGVPAELKRADRMRTDRGWAKVYRETVEGQAPRLILDLEDGSFTDEFSERIVPAGHIFVMGDHRDNSADSRVPQQLGGSGMVPIAKLKGRALFIFWSKDSSRIGARLH